MHDQVTSDLHLNSTYLIETLKVSIFQANLCIWRLNGAAPWTMEVAIQKRCFQESQSHNEDNTVAILSMLWQWEFSPSGRCLYIETTSWRHQMETFFVLLALCEGNTPVTGGFPSQRPVTRGFIFIFFNLNKQLNKQSRRRWFLDTIAPTMTSL